MRPDCGVTMHSDAEKDFPFCGNIFSGPFRKSYTADIVHAKGVRDQELPFLSKPVAPQALLKKVREILGSRIVQAP